MNQQQNNQRQNHQQQRNQQQNNQQPLPGAGASTVKELDFSSETLYDRQDLLQKLNICVRTLQYWRSKGLLPYYKIRSKVYYRKTDLEELFQKNRLRKG